MSDERNDRNTRPGNGIDRLNQMSAAGQLPPLVIDQLFTQEYRISYGQDSPYFASLARGVLLGSHCLPCDYRWATPRQRCSRCGQATQWFELSTRGRVHSYTICHYAGERFLAQTPFTLVLVEFEGVDTLLLSRLVHDTDKTPVIGMQVRAQFSAQPRLNAADLSFVPVET